MRLVEQRLHEVRVQVGAASASSSLGGSTHERRILLISWLRLG